MLNGWKVAVLEATSVPNKKCRTDVWRCSSDTTQPALCEWEQISGTCTSWVLSDKRTQNASVVQKH